MDWSHRVASHPVTTLAVKAALASGIAFYLGGLLPAPLDDYRYYAALGAFTVIGLVVTDSVKEALRVVAAVVIGVAVAVALQAVLWASAVTVAVAVLLSVLVAALPVLGQQRSWAPLAALFVLATAGPDPQPMALGYLVQVPLGAAVGIVVNVVIFAPLRVHDLKRSADALRVVLARQMRQYAELFQAQDDPTPGLQTREQRAEVVHASLHELQQAQARLRTDTAATDRARKGNPRTWFGPGSSSEQAALADALSQCGTAVEAVAVMLRESTPPQHQEGVELRRETVDMLNRAAEVFDSPEHVQEEQSEMLRAARRSVARVVDRVESMSPDEDVDRYLLGALALTTRQALDAFVEEVASRTRTPGPGSAAGGPVRGDR